MARKPRWKTVSIGEYGWLGQLLIADDGVAQDISSYNTLEFIYVRPDATTFTRTASFATNGVNGLLQYLHAEGDIDAVAGMWKVYARIVRISPPAELTSKSNPCLFLVQT